jgi:hypothetical protein
MRPVVPDFLPSPPRKPSPADPPAPSCSESAAPTSFFLAREMHDDLSASRDTTYGVQSLEETINTADFSLGVKDDAYRRDSNVNECYDANSRRRTTLRPSDFLHHIDRTDTPLSKSLPRASPGPSRPLTPFGLADEPSSLPSSPKSTSTRSFKPIDDLSITDEISSQALASSGDEEDVPEMGDRFHHHGVGDNSSQLIMPSIRMPSRRPFTDKGKNFGRFKILVAGSKGIFHIVNITWSGSQAHIYKYLFTRFRQVFIDQVDCPSMRRYRSCRPRRRLGIARKWTSSLKTKSQKIQWRYTFGDLCKHQAISTVVV